MHIIMNQPIIAPSILSADFARLYDEVTAVLSGGAEWIHFDVMDNHYVPNLTFGPLVCEALKKNKIEAPIDVHLMTSPVDSLIQAFAKAGASYITFHPEASNHVDRSLQLIRDLGCKSGIALNPATPVEVLDYIWDKIDLILVMSVNPGFGGQSFIPSALDKIKRISEKIKETNPSIRLSVDGGVNLKTIKKVQDSGADTFVMGSAIFNSDHYETTIQSALSLLGA